MPDQLPDLITPIRSWARREPEAPAITFEGTTTSRGELDRISDSAAAELVKRGVRPGDRVGIMGGIEPDWAIAALGVLKAGAVIVPMTERLSSHEVSKMLSHVDASMALSDDAHAEIVAGAQGGWTHLTFSAMKSSAPEGPPMPGPQGDQLAIIAFTSGSTGRPKGSMFTHNGISNALFEWVLQVPELLRCRALDVTSLAYLGGLLNGFMAPLIFGGSTVMLPKWDPRDALSLINSEGITSMACTTIFYDQMANHPDFETTDLSSVSVAIAGGSPVLPELVSIWNERGVSLRQGYGLTEGCSLVTLPPADVAISHPDVAGVGSVLRQLKIVDAHGNASAMSEPGEILIAGPGISAGYWNDPETTAEEFADGWLRTGDIGTFDDQGHLRIVGRTKDVIISGGINIYAAELERVIGELAGVTEVAVIGVADEQFGETPAALVFADRVLTDVEVADHCRSQLASYKVPRYVIFLDEPLPRSPIGKITKVPLKERFADIPAYGRRMESRSTSGDGS